MTNLRLVCAVATIVALSKVHAGGQAQNNNNNNDNNGRKRGHKQHRRTAAKRNQNARKGALAASAALKDAADNANDGHKATLPQEAAAKDNINNAQDDGEKMEKIGEDIALLKLDDKMYWNRFLQNSGSMSESPSAAPSMEDG